MQADALVARRRQRFTCTTMSDHHHPVAAMVLDREFTAEAPNRRWVGDTTEFVIGDRGKLYLAVLLDLYSRFVVGWAVSAVNDRHLTLKALALALKRRCPDIGLLHHSDRGCTDASEDYQRMLDAHGIACSMSRRGDCHDNAVMEAFFSTLKTELADRFSSFGGAKWSSLTTSRCSITSVDDTPQSATSAPPDSSAHYRAAARRHSRGRSAASTRHRIRPSPRPPSACTTFYHRSTNRKTLR
jgi:transposase InsO family protein